MTDAHAQVLAALQEQMRNTEAKHQKEIVVERLQQSDTIKADLEKIVAGMARMSELLELKDDKGANREAMSAGNGKHNENGTVLKVTRHLRPKIAYTKSLS